MDTKFISDMSYEVRIQTILVHFFLKRSSTFHRNFVVSDSFHIVAP